MNNKVQLHQAVNVTYEFINSGVAASLEEKHFVHISVHREVTDDSNGNVMIMNEMNEELQELIIKKTFEVLDINDPKEYLSGDSDNKIATIYIDQTLTSLTKEKGSEYWRMSLDLVIVPLIRNESDK